MDKFISENFLTAEEVSGILRIPLPTIYRLTQQSKIKAVKIGKQWRYRKEDIERYLQFGTDFSKEPSRRIHDTLENVRGPNGMRSDLLRFWAPKAGRQGLTPFHGDFKERRAYPRINTNFRCKCLINLPPFKIINSLGIIKNLSADGVFVVGNSGGGGGVETDDPVELKFSIVWDNGESAEINVKGKVIRKTGDGLGIKFKSINKEMQNRILEYTV